MVKWTPIFCIIVIGFLVVSAGCTAGTSTSSTSSSKSSTTKKATPTPTPSFGTIQVSSSPWGAMVYLDDGYRGVTPLNLTNVPIGDHDVRLTMPDYASVNGTVKVTGGKTVTFSKTLQRPTAKIDVSVSSVTTVWTPCKWIFKGTVTSTGEITAQGITLTATMTPVERTLTKATKTYTVGTLSPGASRDFYLEVPVTCGEYKGALAYKFTDKFEKSYSGTVKM